MEHGANRVIAVACAIISTAHRWTLVRDHILPTVLNEPFAEVVVAGDGESGEGYRHLCIPRITGTTIDALVKRDAAAVATTAEYLLYLSDDHRPLPGIVAAIEDTVQTHPVEVLVPDRVTWRGSTKYSLNSGAAEGYCGGHAGLFARDVIAQYPWTTAPHHPLWDLYHSRRLQDMGIRFDYAPTVIVEDVEHLLNPGVQPWK